MINIVSCGVCPYCEYTFTKTQFLSCHNWGYCSSECMELGESGKAWLSGMKKENNPDYEFEFKMHSMRKAPVRRKGILS